MPFVPDSASTAAGRFVPDSAAPPSDGSRSIGEIVNDLGASALGGLVSAAKLPAMGMDRALSGQWIGPGVEALSEFESSVNDQKSEVLRKLETESQGRVKAAGQGVKDRFGDEGFLPNAARIASEFGVGALEAVKDPSLLSSSLAQQAPMLGMSRIFGTGADALARGTAAVAPKLAATRAGQAAVGGAGTAGAVAGGAGMQAADIGSDAYLRLLALPDAQWQAVPGFTDLAAEIGPQAAKERMASEKASEAALQAGAASVLSSALPGGASLEKALIGKAGGAGVNPLRTVGQSVRGEAIQEGVEEGYGQLAANAAVKSVNPNQELVDGVGGAAGQGAALGGLMGGGATGIALARSGAGPAAAAPAPAAGAAADPTGAVDADEVLGGVEPPAQAAVPAKAAATATPPGAVDSQAELDRAWGEAVAQSQAPEAATEAEKALRTPRPLTSLDRVNEINAELTAGKADEAKVLDLQAERAALTKDWPKTLPGAPTTFSTEAGARVEAQYALIEADDLQTSHDVQLRPNPDYPKELQPRERDRAASATQIAGMEQRLDPARLGVSADAANGAPIIGADGLVESGNARTIALRRVYRANGLKADEYRTWLQGSAAQFGLTPEAVGQMRQPLLVRVRTTPVNRAEFARQANASTVAAMSPSEQARSDSNRIDAMDDLSPNEDGDFSTSRDFIRRFMARLPQTEQSGMIDATGQLSAAGYARVRNAVLAKAYGDSPVLARMTESMDDNMRNVSRALMIAAPRVAQARGAIKDGARFDADITPHLVDAVEQLSRLKDDGTSVDDALAQGGIFGDTYSPETAALLRFLADNARRPRKMAEFITAYFDALDAAGDPRQAGIFGDTEAPSTTDLMGAARRVTNPPTEGATDATSDAPDAQRRDAGKAAPSGNRTAGQPEDAQGGRRGDQGDGTARPAAANEEDAEGQGRRVAENDPPALNSATPIRLFDRYARFGDKPGTGQGGVRAAADVLGLKSLDTVMDSTLHSNSPAALNLQTGAVHINPAFTLSGAHWAQVMVEELLHGADRVGLGVTMSATSRRLDATGDIGAEAQAVFASGKGLADFLAYPLWSSKDLGPDRVKAELFARLGVIYHGDPALMRRELPVAYEAYHEIFGLIQTGPDQFVRPALPGAGRQAGPEVSVRPGASDVARAEVRADVRNDGVPAGGRQPGAGVGPADHGLGSLRGAVARVFEADRAGGVVRGPAAGPLEARAAAVERARDALGDVVAILSRHTRASMLPEDHPGLMPALVKLFDAAIDIVGTDLKRATAWVKEQLRADPRTKAVWNRVAPETYRKAAQRAMAQRDERGQADGLFAADELPALAQAALQGGPQGDLLDGAESAVAPQRNAGESKPKIETPPAPLYASRQVTNAADIVAWAKAQGFKSTLPAGDLHVTVAYSRDAVDGSKVPAASAGVAIDGGKRSVEPLGSEGAVVLKFSSPELQSRWRAYRDAGASWDFDGYTPHVTITYDGGGLDLSKIEPYSGPIELGAEKQEPLNVDKADDHKEAPTAKKAPNKIDDAGQKIGGARKDWRDRGLTATDLDAMSEAEGATLATKANVWKPDYQALVADGGDPSTAAMVKVVYDSLAAQPKKNTPEGRRDYVRAMQAVREVYSAVRTPDEAKNAFRKVREALGLREGVSSFAEDQKEASRLLFSVYRGRSDPFVFGYNELTRARKMVADGFPGAVEPWTRRFVVRAVGGPGLTDRGVEIHVKQAQDLGTPMTAEQLRAGVFEVRDKSGRAQGVAATKADAEAMAKAIYDRARNGGDSLADPERPHLDALKRENLERALDRDAAPSDMLEAFGFRGIEWGNWAAQDERQKILNMAYDAMADLARVLNVPRRALSLNGTLGIAFGARGGGKFAAHYEAGKLVINMTKLRGAGSLAHEFAHAFDHYLGELGRADAYQTLPRGASGWRDEQRYDGRPVRRTARAADGKVTTTEQTRLGNLRPELADKLEAVMRALFTGQQSQAAMLKEMDASIARAEAFAAKEVDDTGMRDMYRRQAENYRAARAEVAADPPGTTYPKGRSAFAAEAQKLSGKSTKGYWLRPTEMFARAFEAYVFDRLVASGARSDYLVHGVEAERYAGDGYRGNPYPTGEERATINRAFDAMVAELKTRPGDDGNVAMFSRAGPAEEIDTDKLESAADILLLWGQQTEYQYPKTDAKDLGEIAAAKGASAEESSIDQMDGTKKGTGYWTVTLPENKRTGEIPTVVMHVEGDTVSINVSGMKEGDGGSLAYDIAAQYALNNGKMFIGDPDGLSDAAMRRRLENMLSSAIKYGTTDHIEPHARQLLGDAKMEIPPLKWQTGDTRGNILSMLRVANAINSKTQPIGSGISYDAGRGAFVDGEGNPVVNAVDALRDISEFERASSGAGAAGGTTLQRAALFRALLRQPAARRSLLERLRGISGERGSETGGAPELNRALYSRAGVAAESTGLTVDRAREIADSLSAAGKLKINVTASVNDWPAGKRDAALSASPTGKIRGAYFKDGSVWVATDNIKSEAELYFVIMHEAFHKGLVKAIGPDAKRLLNQMYASNAKLRKLANDQVTRHGIPLDEAIEEALADLAGKGEAADLRLWPKLLELIKGWLQGAADAIGLRLTWTDAMVMDFVAGVREEGLKGDAKVRVTPKIPASIQAVIDAMDAKPTTHAAAKAHLESRGFEVRFTESDAALLFKDGKEQDARAMPPDVRDALNVLSLDEGRPWTEDTRFSRSGATPGRRGQSAAAGNLNGQSVVPVAAPQSAWTKAKAGVARLTDPDTIDKLIYEIQDKFIDLKRLRDHIQSIGGTITDLNDAYLGEELYHKRLAKRTEDFLADEIKPLLADQRNRNISTAELEQYLHARHAPEANAAMAERNPNQATIDQLRAKAKQDVQQLEQQLAQAQRAGSATKAIESALELAQAEASRLRMAQAFKGTEDERLALSGMSDAEAAAVMAGLAPGKRQHLEALAARIDAINAKTLTLLESYGLMSKETLDAWRAAYRYYVPLHRDEAHAESGSHPIGQGFSVKGDAARQRVGSNEKVTHILGHIAMQREAALTRGEKNHVVKKLYLMAAQNPDPDFWSVDKLPTTKTVDPVSGLVRAGVDPRYKTLPNVVMLRIAGRDEAITFNERDPQALRLAEAMKNLDVGDLHAVLGLAAKATRWFASVNTQYNPIFGLINFARDVQESMLTLSTTPIAGKQREVASGVMAAMRAIYRTERGKAALDPEWTRLWKELQEVGGTTGYRDLYADAQDRVKALERELKALDRGQVSQAAHAVVDWLSDYNETMENSVRLSAYRVALDSGMSKPRAASLAKNLTVNFNRKGRQTREIGALYAFFNAAVQGTTRMVQTLTGPMGRKIMYGGVLLGVANTMLGMAVMGGGDDGDDPWSRIPEFIKERSIIIPLGREDYATIPMPLGFKLFPNIGRLAVEFAFGGSEKTAGRQLGHLMMVLADSFNPLGGVSDLTQMAAPTVIDPVVSLLKNRDWTGRPIYRENGDPMDPKPGHALVKDSASTPSRWLAYAINAITGGTEYRPGGWSPTPDQIDYVIGQLTGGLGRELLKVNQTLAAPITGDELPAYKVPLLGRLYGNTRGTGGQSETYYANVKLLNELENEVKGRQRNGQDADAFRKEEPLTALIGASNMAERRVDRLRKQRREVTERAGDGYRDRVKEIDVDISKAMSELNAEVRAARKRRPSMSEVLPQ